MDHVGSVNGRGSTFEGVRISKGASRTASHVALRRMVRAPDEGDRSTRGRSVDEFPDGEP